jgi:hypothetical protein
MLEQDPLFLVHANTGQGYVAQAKPLIFLCLYITTDLLSSLAIFARARRGITVDS